MKKTNVLVQVSFLIPLTDDRTGDLHSVEKFEKFEEKLFIMFGGWTDGGVQQGIWRNPKTNKATRDSSKRYYIALERDDIPKLRRYLKKAKILFGQESLYFEVKGDVEFL